MAQNKHDHLPSKTASMLHDANLRLFMAEVKRCHRSFEDFIEECRQKNLPDETTSVNSEENLKPAGCFIVECETLVVRLWWDAEEMPNWWSSGSHVHLLLQYHFLHVVVVLDLETAAVFFLEKGAGWFLGHAKRIWTRYACIWQQIASHHCIFLGRQIFPKSSDGSVWNGKIGLNLSRPASHEKTNKNLPGTWWPSIYKWLAINWMMSYMNIFTYKKWFLNHFHP